MDESLEKILKNQYDGILKKDEEYKAELELKKREILF